MYLRAAKTEAEEAGESTDGMADSVSELREELMSLAGIDIQADDKSFKSTYEILKELSDVWDGLSDITQANITELIGGKRNANVVTALLENFDIAENALATSLGSVGSATAENEKYLDSVQGKIDLMKASFESLSSNVISSDFLKNGVSAITSILNIVNALVDKVGVLPPLFAAISAGFSAKNIGRDKVSSLYKYADIYVCSVGYDSFHIDVSEIHRRKRSLNMRGNRYNAATLLLWQQNQNRNNAALRWFAGIALTERSPHCSDNRRSKLYETML